MKPAISIDDREWKKAARELFATSKRSLPDWLNGQMLRLLSWTIYDTAKASKKKIENLMKKKARDGRGTVAEKLLFSYKARTGEWPVRGSTHEDRVERLKALKQQSVAMLRAGWLKAMNFYRRIVYQQPPGAKDKKNFGRENSKLKGWAKPAVFRLGTITAEAANEALGYRGAERAWTGVPTPSGALPVAEKGLRIAMARQTKDMMDTLARRLKRDWAKHGAK